MPHKTIPTTPPAERAFLVGVEFRSEKPLISLEDSLSELALLAQRHKNWTYPIQAL